MAVDTKTVTGRREVRYETMEELLEDVKNYSGTDVKMIGNWSQGQIFKHLADTMDLSIDGFGMKFPLPLRIFVKLFMKNKFLYKAIPSGFKAPDQFQPDETSTEEGVELITKAIARQQEDSNRALHPGFGTLTLEEWTQFHLRHAEMHMSFMTKG